MIGSSETIIWKFFTIKLKTGADHATLSALKTSEVGNLKRVVLWEGFLIPEEYQRRASLSKQVSSLHFAKFREAQFTKWSSRDIAPTATFLSVENERTNYYSIKKITRNDYSKDDDLFSIVLF